MIVPRRALLVAFVLFFTAVPRVADAQRAERVYRIGVLERTSPAINAANFEGFKQGLREHGYVEGKNLVIEYRSADGRDDRFPDLAAELVRSKVDLILTRGTPAALAAKRATETIPVVMTGTGNPVAAGIVASLARPGGNVTGISSVSTELDAKRVELLRELVPKTTRLVALYNMGNPAIPPAWKEVETAARALGIQPQLLDVRKVEDLAPAFEEAIKQRADAMLVGLETLTQTNQRLIVELAAKHRLPAVYSSQEFAGGLVIYGVNYPEHYRRAAAFADKIFKGTRPTDLPVERPTTFELVINTRAARALGLTIPPSLLLRADQVIQ
jgi:putative tryptophan/tyrosine transport system substrate-binding protein